MKNVSPKLAALAIAGMMLLAAACSDSTAPHRDCWVTSNGMQCDPG